MNNFKYDMESFSKCLLEILQNRRPKLWTKILKTPEDYSDYCGWLARWMFHYANKALLS